MKKYVRAAGGRKSDPLRDEAFDIGYKAAERSGSLTTPAHCKELMAFLRTRTDNSAGSSIPYLESFAEGQATWFHDEALKLVDEGLGE